MKTKKNTIEEQNKKVIHLYNMARNSEWTKYTTNAQEWYEFFLGEQLSEKQFTDLQNAGMPTFINNKITPGINNLKYYVTANNPSFIAVAKDGKSTDLADIHQNVLSYNSYISNGKAVNELVFTDTLVKGCGCYQVYVDKDADGGKGEVKYGYTNYQDIFIDGATTDKFLDTSKWILVRKYFTRGMLKEMYPDFKEKIDKGRWIDDRRVSYSGRDVDTSQAIFREDISSIMDSEGKEETLIPVFELYEKVKIPLCSVTILEQSNKEMLRIIQDQVKQESQAFQEQLALQMEDALITMKEEFDNKRITKERFEFNVKTMQMNTQKQVLDFEDQKLSQLINEKTYSQTRQITKQEYELLSKSKLYKDKIIEKSDFNGFKIKYRLQIGSDIFVREDLLPTDKYPIIPVFFMFTGTPYPLSAVALVKGKQQEITKAHQISVHNANLASNFRVIAKRGTIDEEVWADQFTVPGSINLYDGETAPQMWLPQNLTNAFTEMIMRSETELEEVLGSTQIMRGAYNPDQSTARGIYAAEEQGSRAIKSWVNNMLEPALERLGQVLTDFDQAVYKTHKVFRIVNPETNSSTAVEINKPEYNLEGKIVSKYFDYSSTQFDVRLISGSTLPVDRFRKLNLAIEMLKINCATRREVIEQSDFVNKERLLAELSEIEQLQGQVQSLTDQLKAKEGDIQTFERELTHLQIKEKVNEHEKVLSKHMADYDARSEKEITNLKADVKIMQNDLKREIESEKNNT